MVKTAFESCVIAKKAAQNKFLSLLCYTQSNEKWHTVAMATRYVFLARWCRRC